MESKTQMYKLPGNVRSWSFLHGIRLCLREWGGAHGRLYQVNIQQVMIYRTQEGGVQHGTVRHLCPSSSLISSKPTTYTQNPFPIWSLYKERWMMCVRRTEENAVGPAQQPRVGVAVCPLRHFSKLLQGLSGSWWERWLARMSWGSVCADTTHEVPGCANYGGEYGLCNLSKRLRSPNTKFVS